MTFNNLVYNSPLLKAPLLYNWYLDEASVFTRVTGLLRAFLMMGALIPLNINTMSIFSFSAKLCIDGDFIHPGYQMDDIIALIRWMGVAKKRLKIVCIPVIIPVDASSKESTHTKALRCF